MSFFFPELRRSVSAKTKREQSNVSVELLHQLECNACPLNKVSVHSPKMLPTGTDRPLIYILGEAPGKTEDELGKQFVGESGQLLRGHLPKWVLPQIRWNNTIRTRPPDNRTPSFMEIESCRPSIERDIMATRPGAIFGFGGIPLQWALRGRLSESRMKLWRGRRFPLQVGDHSCWFYPFMHPSYLLRRRGETFDDEEDSRLDYEFMFRLDLARACQAVDAGLPAPWVPTTEEISRGIEIITETTEEDLNRITQALHRFAKMKLVPVGVDFETEDLRPYGKAMLSMSVCSKDGGIAFLIDHPRKPWPASLRKRLQKEIILFLAESQCIKIAHNIGFELEWAIEKFGTSWLRQSPWGCSLAGAYVLDERKDGHSLEFTVFEAFGFNVKSIYNMNRKSLLDEEIEDLLPYNGLDAKWAAHLAEHQRDRIEDEGLSGAYREQVRRVFTVALTQRKGLCVDFELVEEHYEQLSQEVEKIEALIADHKDASIFHKRMGYPFNPNSTQDAAILFDEILRYREGRRGKKYSTDESVLKRIDHPIAGLLLQLRGVKKLCSTYVEPIRKGGKHIHPDQRIHTIYNTTYTTTGRLSSDSPNTQNFPHRENPWIRCVVTVPRVPKRKVKLVAVDYGQIEARGIAMYSHDKFLIEALFTKYDIHVEWAERWAAEYPAVIGGKKFRGDKGVMKAFRGEIKNQFVFPCFYGAQAKSIARSMNTPDYTTQRIWNEFWRIFSGVKQWQEDLIARYNKEGFVERFGGWKRRGPLTTNMIINTPIQGSCSDIVVDSMNRLSELEVDPEEGDWNQAVMNIHDDLEFYLFEDELEIRLEEILDLMLFPPFDWINVPLSAEVSIGDNWGALEEIGAFFSNEWR